MQYLLLIYMDKNAMSDTDREHCYVETVGIRPVLEIAGLPAH